MLNLNEQINSLPKLIEFYNKTVKLGMRRIRFGVQVTNYGMYQKIRKDRQGVVFGLATTHEPEIIYALLFPSMFFPEEVIKLPMLPDDSLFVGNRFPEGHTMRGNYVKKVVSDGN